MLWRSSVEPTGGACRSVGDDSPRWRGTAPPSCGPSDLWPQHGRRRPPPAACEWVGTPCNACERGESVWITIRMKRKSGMKRLNVWWRQFNLCMSQLLTCRPDRRWTQRRPPAQRWRRAPPLQRETSWTLQRHRTTVCPTFNTAAWWGEWIWLITWFVNFVSGRCLCVTNQVHPGTCWWWRWCWSGPGCSSPPGWCWRSRCRAPQTFAWDEPHTRRTEARHRTWCYAPECSRGPTRWCRLRWGCWGRGAEGFIQSLIDVTCPPVVSLVPF